MAIDTAELRGVIYKQYGTASAFANVMGWKNRNKVGNILNGKYVPDIDECADMAEKLNLSQSQFCTIFLRQKSPYGDIIARAE